MKSKKIILCLVITLLGLCSYSLADQCTTSCVSTDPFEVANCLLECEAN